MEDHPMITVSNQVCLAKMATRGFQEGRVEKEGLFLSPTTEH
jgi:hypothetical protein